MIWKKLLTFCAVGMAAFLAENARELRTFIVTRYTISPPKLKGLKKDRTIVFLSDLHNREYGVKNDELLKAIRKEQPDLILVGGDMLVGKADVSWQPAADFMVQLPEIAPVYCANGNHEQRMKERPDIYQTAYRRYQKELMEAGIRFLENDSVFINWDDCRIQLSGLEIPSIYYEKFARGKLEKEAVVKKLGNPEPSTYQILLAHNPVFFDAYREWGADLVLSGHLHGGIIRIPGWRGLITPQAGLFPKYSGELTEKNGFYIAVSKGMGTHTVNIRFCNPAELVVLKLRGTADTR